MVKNILIVGHGPISHSFIEKLVERHVDFEITVICEEPRPAYNRVNLTQYFKDRDSEKHDQMQLSYGSEAELKEQGVTIVYGRATAIDRQAQTVTYTSPQKPDAVMDAGVLPYDMLVMATGSFCFVPPVSGMTLPEKKNAQWPDDPASRPEGVFVYRTIEDLDGLLAASNSGAKRAVVIGGGLLGLEAAKAVYDLNMESHVLEMAPYLMPTQLDEPGGRVLTEKISKLGITVHAGVQIKEVVLSAEGKVQGIRLLEKGSEEPILLETDVIVVSCGVRPRDELARQCGLDIGARGGVKVDACLRSSDEKIYAIGEVASIGGSMCYGLWAPGVEQADALVKTMVDGDGSSSYLESDLSTKLKLLGVDVASFGRSADFWFKRQFDGKNPDIKMVTAVDSISGSYRCLCFSADGSRLMGGILVGDAKDYTKLLQLSKKPDLGGNDPAGLAFGRPPPGAINGASVDGGDGTGLADDDVICSCLNVTKGEVRKSIIDYEAYTVPQIKKCCKAGTGCGGCVAPVGEVPKLLSHTLKKLGKAGFTGICDHLPYTRKELFDIVKIKELKSYEDILTTVGKGGSTVGCEVCKPICASILGGLWNDHCLKSGLDQIQDTNDRFCANIQKTGTYSIIPRCAGGDITADKLISFGSILKEYGLWGKITGAQRLGMYGAPVHQMPEIFKKLVDAGFETGQAYGKALRTVKSCVGSTWCRYGQQDSVTMAVLLEERYKGLRCPHKVKMGVSGCLRECAEAQGKDVGLIATQKGYNLFVCGNGGAKPAHAVLLAQDLSEEECFKYTDRFLMYYISTAKHLQRTAPWLAELEGGIEYLKKVVIQDSLGVGADLEAMMDRNRASWTCDWKQVVYDEDLQKQFKQFANTPETHDSEQIEYIDMRGQRHPNTYSPPDILGPALYLKEMTEDSWEWIYAGDVADFPQNGGLAVKYGNNELAVFHLPKCSKEDQWLVTQNICPHKQARTISRSLVGEKPSGELTIADPIYKTVYNLRTGQGISNPNFNLSTFQVKVDEDGKKLLVKVPPAATMEKAFEEQIEEAYRAAKVEHLKRPDVALKSEAKRSADPLDW